MPLNIRAVCLDAGGTLVEPIRPVGETYAAVAARHGRGADPALLQARFTEAWGRRSAGAPERSPVPLTAAVEREWWKALVREVFATSGPFPSFDEFFDELHESFSAPEAWRIYPEVRDTIGRLRAAGIRLAVVSNWDARLEALFVRLDLRGAFAGFVVSGVVGVAKPDPGIFALALEALEADPGTTLHVGDSLRDDVHGAIGHGLRAAWLRRKGEQGEVPPGVPVVTSLEEVVGLVLS